MCNQITLDKVISINILIDSPKKINTYLRIIGKVEDKVYMKSGEKYINGKSLMSIFNLDISKPVTIYNIPIYIANELRELCVDR